MLIFVGVVNVVVAVVIVDPFCCLLKTMTMMRTTMRTTLLMMIMVSVVVVVAMSIAIERDVDGDDDDVESVDMRVPLFNFVLYYFKATLKH